MMWLTASAAFVLGALVAELAAAVAGKRKKSAAQRPEVDQIFGRLLDAGLYDPPVFWLTSHEFGVLRKANRVDLANAVDPTKKLGVLGPTSAIGNKLEAIVAGRPVKVFGVDDVVTEPSYGGCHRTGSGTVTNIREDGFTIGWDGSAQQWKT